MLLVVLVLLLIKKHTGLLRRNRQAVCFKSKKSIVAMRMKRNLAIFQYGSQFDPTGPTRYSPSDWIEISKSEGGLWAKSNSKVLDFSPSTERRDFRSGFRKERLRLLPANCLCKN